MSTIDQLLEDADKHPEKVKRLLQRIAIGITTEEMLRSLLLEGLLREVATKHDLKELGENMERGFEALNHRIDAMPK